MVKIEQYQINDLFSMISEIDCMHKENWITIDGTDRGFIEEFSGEGDSDSLTIDLLSRLDGYKVKIQQKGEHHNDGQSVRYILTFKNSKNKVTKLDTLMNLVMGFDYHQDEVIK